MTITKNVVLPVLGVFGVGLLCGHFLWKCAAQQCALRNSVGQMRSNLTDAPNASAGWALGETEVFSSLQFLPH